MAKKHYDEMSDEELCIASKEDDFAEEYLLIKHKPLVLKLARPLYLTYGEKEDLIQEGMIGLYHAIVRFQPETGAKFSTFAHTCIQHQMFKAIEAGNRKRDIPISSVVSLSDEETLGENAPFGSVNNPEQILIDRETVAHLLETLKDRLSSLELMVLEDYMDGLTYQDIAKKMERPPKSIDNAIQRIKAKMRQVLREEN